MRTLADVVAVIEELYPPEAAQSWDQVGLVTGDPAQQVQRLHLALDPTLAVIEEARALGADLLFTHHPLLMRGVHSVATTTAKGASITNLVVGDVALYVAHTNADVASRGVAEALAAACGLDAIEPLVIEEGRPMGRVGELSERISLREFASRVSAALPPAPVGLRVAGDPEAQVCRVAVSGGAGDGFFGAARAVRADVYVTADLRHHPALEAREEGRGGPPFLIDAGHWASEASWLPWAADDLRERLGEDVEITVSELCTDPWTFTVVATQGAGPGR
ncbi:Nif3-like dinuclear metal center hexameric protein [Nostocoides australiense]|nr:Nif3-like dinuclear metal center hexameric protein [Tetrasphaera australiensis]